VATAANSPSAFGRGAVSNPTNRFARLQYETDPDVEASLGDDEKSGPRTMFFEDGTKSILSRNDSPDVGFEYSVNPYRGCEHGCVYCYARPTHEYLGFSAGLDFESRIMVKRDAPELLRKALAAPTWKPQVVAFSGVTDCYQPIERKLRLTRRCLQVCADFRNPAGIVTKNHAVTADLDVLRELARHEAIAVYISIATLDSEIAKKMEPRASTPARRLAAIRELSEAGIPTGLLLAPIVPGLTEHEIPEILKAAAEAGARFAGYTMLRLPYAVKQLFDEWLTAHFPGHREKVLGRIRDVREGQLNDSDFASRMTGTGVLARQIRQLFRVARERVGINPAGASLSTKSFRRPGTADQLDLL
jgi:DNA repair photolyase